MAILEAHAQAHEAWWLVFGTKEKRIMSTPPPDPPDDQIWLDDEGRAMIVNSHHYTAENIAALISELKRLEDPQQTTLGDWNNKDWRTWSGVLWRVLAALATDVPLAAQAQPDPQTVWHDIETAPQDEEVLFWIRPKTAEETYHDSYGEPLLMSGKAGARICKFRCWGILEIATHWMPLPAAPALDGDQP